MLAWLSTRDAGMRTLVTRQGESFLHCVKKLSTTQDPGRVDGARMADSSVGGGGGEWREGESSLAATSQGKGILGRSVAELRAQTERFKPPPRSGGASGNHRRWRWKGKLRSYEFESGSGV